MGKRRPGEVRISEAATMLEVHPDTVRRWAQEAASGAAARIQSVRRDTTGWYWIPVREVVRLKIRDPDENY